MMDPLIPGLAVGSDNLMEPIIYGIGTIILVGGWIANQVKRMNEQSGKTPGPQPPAEEEATEDASPGINWQELVERRRAELTRMAEQRRARRRDKQTAPEGTPAMDSRVLRKVEIREEARLERHRGRVMPSPHQWRSESSAPAQPSSTRPTTLPPGRDPMPKSAAPTRDRPRKRQKVAKPGSKPTREQTATVAKRGPVQTRRVVSDLALPEVRRRESRAGLLLQGSSLRTAILWKEILDRPLALRQEDEPFV